MSTPEGLPGADPRHRAVRQGRSEELSPEAAAYFENKDCPVIAKPTPEAIQAYNKSTARKIGLFHVTC